MNAIGNGFPSQWGALLTTTNTVAKTSLVVVLLFIYFIYSFFYELSSDYSSLFKLSNAHEYSWTTIAIVLHISNAVLVTAVHVKMKLGDNALNNERLLFVDTKFPPQI